MRKNVKLFLEIYNKQYFYIQSNIFVFLYNVGTNFTLYVFRIYVYVFIKEIRRVQASKTNLLAKRLSTIKFLLIDPINHV